MTTFLIGCLVVNVVAGRINVARQKLMDILS